MTISNEEGAGAHCEGGLVRQVNARMFGRPDGGSLKLATNR